MNFSLPGRLYSRLELVSDPLVLLLVICFSRDVATFDETQTMALYISSYLLNRALYTCHLANALASLSGSAHRMPAQRIKNAVAMCFQFTLIGSILVA